MRFEIDDVTDKMTLSAVNGEEAKRLLGMPETVVLLRDVKKDDKGHVRGVSYKGGPLVDAVEDDINLALPIEGDSAPDGEGSLTG